ncbi:MAG TPA: hypothetical protein VGA69_06315 [Nitriliruptorales bacterium]
MSDTEPPRSIWQRIERTQAGRTVITLGILLIFTIVVVWNLPESALRSAGLDLVRTPASVAGLDQNWRVFAPNPRRIALDLYAIVEYPDGQIATWQLPDESEPFLSPYRTYRWRKWMEHVRLDDKKGLWRPAAEWVAREFTIGERAPSKVSLVRRWYDLPAPGTGAETPAWNEYTYYELDVG